MLSLFYYFFFKDKPGTLDEGTHYWVDLPVRYLFCVDNAGCMSRPRAANKKVRPSVLYLNSKELYCLPKVDKDQIKTQNFRFYCGF